MPNAAAAAGLAFVLTLAGGGRELTSDRFVLRAPGMPGSFTLFLEDPDVYGSTFASPVRIENRTEGDLLAVSVHVVSVTESRASGPREHAGGEGQPPAWERVGKGSDSSAQLLRAGPVDFSPETHLVMIRGSVRGVAELHAFELEEAPSPVEVLARPDGALFVRDSSGTVVRTDEHGQHPALQKSMPAGKARPSKVCAGGPLCRELEDGTVVTAARGEVTVRDPDGRSRAFTAGGAGEITALATGPEGRLYVATAGDGARRGGVRVFRLF